MPSTGRYAPHTRATAELLEAGYFKAWINLLTDFTTLQEPVLSGTPVLGEINSINTAHVWAANKGAIPLYVRKDTIEAPGESLGEKGSQRMVYRPKIMILGDGAKIKEMVDNFLNEELVMFVQDELSPNAKYIQFGGKEYPLEITKVNISSGTLFAGQKGYELSAETIVKFFYNATITQRAS